MKRKSNDIRENTESNRLMRGTLELYYEYIFELRTELLVGRDGFSAHVIVLWYCYMLYLKR